MARDYRVLPPEVSVRATTSNAIQFQLLNGTVPIDLTGAGTVTLHLRDQAGGAASTDNLTGKLTINGTAGGSVSWKPATADLVAGSAPYAAYFKVDAGTAGQYSVPEANEIVVNVRATF